MIHSDAFSSGQIGSKLWLCEELEKLYSKIDYICIYGGWYGITAFLLNSRNIILIKKIRSIDINPECESVADMFNEFWKWQGWKFKAITDDCNLVYHKLTNTPDLIINTSTEHFDSDKWFQDLPKGTHVALQGSDMIHDEHVIKIKDLDQFKELFSLSEIMYEGERQFTYPTWKFKRFMQIGIK